jgi:hypothetical protein
MIEIVLYRVRLYFISSNGIVAICNLPYNTHININHLIVTYSIPNKTSIYL